MCEVQCFVAGSGQVGVCAVSSVRLSLADFVCVCVTVL